jgi:hypothetical protein
MGLGPFWFGKHDHKACGCGCANNCGCGCDNNNGCGSNWWSGLFGNNCGCNNPCGGCGCGNCGFNGCGACC